MSILYYEWKRYWKPALKVAVLCAMILLFSIIFLPFVQEANFVKELRAALQTIPDLMLAFFGFHENQDFTTKTRYLSFIHSFVFAIASLFAAWLGGRCFAKERADGTIDFLLAKPFSRWQIMVYKIAANLLVLLTFVLFYYALYHGVIKLYGIFRFIIEPDAIPIGAFMRAMFALQLLIFSISALISMALPTDKIAVPLALTLTVFFYLFHVSAQSGGAMGALGRLSPFTYMQPIDISLGNPAPIFVFLLLSALFLGAAFALLYNNDIRQKLVK